MSTDKLQHPNGARPSRIRAGDRDEWVRLAEQERIAADLGQIVIHEIFSVGLTLQYCASTRDGVVADRLQGVVVQLDGLIREVRRIVFDQPAKAPVPIQAITVEHNGSGQPRAAGAVLELASQARMALESVYATLSQLLANSAADAEIDRQVTDGVTNAIRLVQAASESVSAGVLR